jgi:septal ring factor EnvC (AmiA/AmiB activator)
MRAWDQIKSIEKKYQKEEKKIKKSRRKRRAMNSHVHDLHLQM